MNLRVEPVSTPLADYIAAEYPASVLAVYRVLMDDVRTSNISNYHSLSELAEETDYSKSTVKRAIDNLKDHLPFEYLWKENDRNETRVRVVHTVPDPFNPETTAITGIRVVG